MAEEFSGSNSGVSITVTTPAHAAGAVDVVVTNAGGTVTSRAKRAIGDEAEFDFDSNPNDIAQGATRISSTFIARRSGPDVVGEILNAQGQVVGRAGVECLFR